MKTAEEIAKEIVYLADNGEGNHPISKGAELIESYAKQEAIKFCAMFPLISLDEKYDNMTLTEVYDQWKLTNNQ